MKQSLKSRRSCIEGMFKIPQAVAQMVVDQYQQTPVKYYIADQILKMASRKEEYIRRQIELISEQSELLLEIRQCIGTRRNNIISGSSSQESIAEGRAFSFKDLDSTIRRGNSQLDELNVTLKKSRMGRTDDVLIRVQKLCAREDFEYIESIMKENKQLKLGVDEQDRYKPMFERERSNNQVLRLQILKYQTKIAELDKQITKSNEKVSKLQAQKQNFTESMVQIQTQIKSNTTTSTSLMINQKILKNQRKRLELQKQMVYKVKEEIQQQVLKMQETWAHYLPAQLVREGRQNMSKYTSLLKQEYSKIKQLNSQIQSFSSRMTLY